MSLELILGGLLAVLVGLGIGLLLARRSVAHPSSPPPVDPRLDQALQALPHVHQELGSLRETVARLPSTDVVTSMRTELAELKSSFRDVNRKVPETFASDLQTLRDGFAQVTAKLEERAARAQEDRLRLQRIEAVVAGAQSRGAAGEIVLAEVFAQFPPEMGDTQFKVNGKTVEFALVLPNRKRLPIDSKWPAVKELELYQEATDPAEREDLLGRIEKAVSKKVEEVTKYIDPATTTNLAIAAIPDAAYFACRTAHIEAYRQRILLMPYSLTLPFLLHLYQLHLQFARSIDVENLDAYLSQVENSLDQFEQKLENSVERGATMVLNAYQELRQRIGQMRGSLAYLRQLPAERLASEQEPLLKE
ncbi:MAG: DNA recombination protein RmuC [Terriglobia bacterium]